MLAARWSYSRITRICKSGECREGPTARKYRPCHQFGEELPPGGSRAMIADGCLDGVDAIYGAHLQSTMDAGYVYVRDGYLQAGEDTVKISVNGSGAHGAEHKKEQIQF